MSRGGKSALPRNVVIACRKRAGNHRYGVKMKFGEKQIRIGSRFCDVDSASKIAKAFRYVATPCEVGRGVFDIDEKKLASLEGRVNVYMRWGTKRTTVTATQYLREWAKAFRLKYAANEEKKRKRKAMIEAEENASTKHGASQIAGSSSGSSATRKEALHVARWLPQRGNEKKQKKQIRRQAHPRLQKRPCTLQWLPQRGNEKVIRQTKRLQLETGRWVPVEHTR